MLNSHQVMLLYSRVLENISHIKCISEKDIQLAIDNMHKVYQGSVNSLSKDLTCLSDYNTVAYRCAYLFKYAPFHTALAYKAMSHALTENPLELQAALQSLSGPLKLCSLGGGPGTDVLGVLAALHDKFGFFPVSAKLIDIMSAWELTFRSVVEELRFGESLFGSLPESVSKQWFDWSFLTADLQSEMSKELTEALGSADIITMVKFVSAAACKETSNMIEKIIRIMKPGAFLLFVDNAAGGFDQLISSAASKYKLETVFKPLKHQHYINKIFFNIKYGYRSCYESKVAVQLLMKSSPLRQQSHTPLYQNFRTGPMLVNSLMNDYESFESGPFNLNETHFSPLPKISPMIYRHGGPVNSPESLYKSFESYLSFGPVNSPESLYKSFESDLAFGPVNSPESLYKSFESDFSFGSNPYTLDGQNWSLRNRNQVHNVDNQNESFESELYQNQIYDTNYRNESFGPELSQIQNYDIDYRGESCEYGLPQNFPLNSTPQTLPFNRKPARALNQFYDPAYGNKLMESRGSWNVSMSKSFLPAPFSPNNSTLPNTVSQTAYISRLNTSNGDSGFIDESFQNEFVQDYSVCDSPLPFRDPQRVVKFRISERKNIYSSHDDESFWNASVNKLPQHQNEDSFISSEPYLPIGVTDSEYHQSPITPVSSLHQSWDGGPRPFRILRQSEKLKGPRIQGRGLVMPYKPFQLVGSFESQSENIPPTWQPSHQYRKKNKAPKKHFNNSKQRHNPYQLKKFRI